MSKCTSIGIEDLYFTTTVTLENVGDNTLFDVRYLRSVDPDPDTVRDSSHNNNLEAEGLPLLRTKLSSLARPGVLEKVRPIEEGNPSSPQSELGSHK